MFCDVRWYSIPHFIPSMHVLGFCFLLISSYRYFSLVCNFKSTNLNGLVGKQLDEFDRKKQNGTF